jgi:hypothetical protein
MRKGFLINEEMRKYLVIYCTYVWLCARSLLNVLIYEENFCFFLTVYIIKGLVTRSEETILKQILFLLTFAVGAGEHNNINKKHLKNLQCRGSWSFCMRSYTSSEGPVKIQYIWQKSINVFPEMNLRGPIISKTDLNCSVSQFPHSCLCEGFIYSQDQSAYFAAVKQVDRSWEYINRSQIHECRNWERGSVVLFWEYINRIFCVF